MKLSALQYTMLRQMPDEFNIDLARRYKQTTFGSMAQRGFIRRKGSKFVRTNEANSALEQFRRAEIFRRVVTDRLSIHFREVLRMRKSA